jgi:hypothetical protein
MRWLHLHLPISHVVPILHIFSSLFQQSCNASLAGALLVLPLFHAVVVDAAVLCCVVELACERRLYHCLGLRR